MTRLSYRAKLTILASLSLFILLRFGGMWIHNEQEHFVWPPLIVFGVSSWLLMWSVMVAIYRRVFTKQ